MDPKLDGFILVDKEVGMTSFDVIRKLQKKFPSSKIGHTGTLDPFASGLLIITLGKATKISQEFLNLRKTYTGSMLFGVSTDTYDITGKVIAKSANKIDIDNLSNEVSSYIKTYLQEVPLYSATKKEGMRLYQYARNNIAITLPKKEVTIYDFKLTSPISHNLVSFLVEVSKGTYIRSLVNDLGKTVKIGATLSELRRIKVGSYSVLEASVVEKISLNKIISLESYFCKHQKITFDQEMVKKITNGIHLDLDLQIASFIAVDKTEKMLAYYKKDGLDYRPVLIF